MTIEIRRGVRQPVFDTFERRGAFTNGVFPPGYPIALGGSFPTANPPLPTANRDIVVGTSSGVSFAAPEQRQVTVIAGRTIFSFFDGTSTKFFWTTGGSRVDFHADLVGAGQVSFREYRDAGGVWRLLAVWWQHGNVAGRVDQVVYAAVGTLSSNLNTLTWGAARQVTYGPWSLTYPDVDVVADGDGGIAMAVYAANVTGSLFASARQMAISSTGILTQSSNVPYIMLARSMTGMVCWPSVAIDPISKHAGVTYSCRPVSGGLFAGPGGTFFRKATYAAGNYTWGDERTLSTDSSILDASQQTNYAACRWDAKRQAWVIGGPRLRTSDNVHGVTEFWKRDLADTATVELFRDVENAIAQEGGTFDIDPLSGDILVYGAVATGIFGLTPQHLHVRTLKYVSTDVVSDQGFVELDPSTDIVLTAVKVVEGAAHILFLRGHASPWQYDYLRQVINQPAADPNPWVGGDLVIDNAVNLGLSDGYVYAPPGVTGIATIDYDSADVTISARISGL